MPNFKEEFIMKQIDIFDPAMCCSTGVCGPSIDSELLRIATTINTLQEKGIMIKRHGLSQEPMDFTTNKVISDILQKEGVDILPVTLVDGAIAKTKEYPSNDELSKWMGIVIDEKPQQNSNRCCCGPKGCC